MPAGLPTRSTTCGRSMITSRSPAASMLYGERSPCTMPVLGHRRQHLPQLLEVRRRAASRLGPGLGQPGRRLAVDGDPLHQQLGAVDLHRVGHRHAEPASSRFSACHSGARPLAGGDGPAEGGLLGHRAGVARVADPPALGVAALRWKLRCSSPRYRLAAITTRSPAVAGHGALEQEDVGLLAGLEDAELGVDGGPGGDHPVGARLGAAAQRFDVVTRWTSAGVGVGFVVGAEVEDETGRCPRGAGQSPGGLRGGHRCSGCERGGSAGQAGDSRGH